MLLWFDKFKKYFVDVMFLLILMYYVFSSFSYFYDTKLYIMPLLIVPIISCYYFLSHFLNKLLKYNDICIKLVIIFVSIAIYLIWNMMCKTIPRSDYAILIDGAKQVLMGTFKYLSFDKQNYFYFYNFQIGYVLYLALIMKMFGTSLISLKIVEILVMSFSNLLVYVIVSKVYSKKEGFLSSLIYGTLFFNIAGSSIINNQHISLLLILLSFYFLIKDDRIIFKFFASICLGIAYLLRPTTIIIIIAIACYYIWRVLNDGKARKNKMVAMLIVAITPFLIVKVADYSAVNIINIAPTSIVSSNANYFKFVLGIQNTGITGSVTEDAHKTQIYFDLDHYGFNYDKYNEASKKYVFNRYDKHTKDTIKYIITKMKAFTGSPDNQIVFSITDDINTGIIDVMRFGGYMQYVLILLFSLIYVLSCFKKREYVESNCSFDVLLKIIFIGYFMIYCLIETQTRYRFEQYLVLSILSGITLNYLFECFDKRMLKKQYISLCARRNRK